jgi:hypothetical protein
VAERTRSSRERGLGPVIAACSQNKNPHE